MMKKFISLFKELTVFEWCLWICSVLIITVSFLIGSEKDILNLIGSIIGVTALIFIAKGRVFGLILMTVFSIFYGYVSFTFKYYGEMLTYLLMSLPTTLLSIISWVKNPYEKGKGEVKVGNITIKKACVILVLTALVTTAFYFILKYFNTANLTVSTVSVATSFIAASLMFVRSPYYALGYTLNDLVLIVLWTLASIADISYLPMVICFATFTVNDTYGFISWHKRQKQQQQLS
jgi:nicotinamide mononucleotide transporter PnuC